MKKYKTGEKKEELFVREAEVAYVAEGKYYTAEEFLKMDFDDDDIYKYELIDGVICKQGCPKVSHERIVVQCIGQFYSYLKGKKCEVFSSNMNYSIQRKWKKENKLKPDSCVKPDVSIVCNKKIIKEDSIYGTPTIAIEVLSKSNSRHDLEIKYSLYEEAGVKEYWIIFPEKKIVRINYLDEKGKYSKMKEFKFTDKIEVKILGDFVFQLETLDNC